MTTYKRFDQAVVELALGQIGRPYIWAGRGEWCVRNRTIMPVQSVGVPPGQLAFDCAGLVDWACWKVTGIDLRGWWGADTLYHFLPEYDGGGESPGDCHRLVFYGRLDRVIHVAFDLGRGLVLEAAGGDETTLMYSDATTRGARVRIGPELRRDRVGSRSLLAAQNLPQRPPTQPLPTPPLRPS